MTNSGSRPECPFCDIVASDAPAREVLRTSQVVAFFPDVPAVLGHTLVVPRKHVNEIFDLDRETSYALADATIQVASAVRSATGASGLNVVQSNGISAGQTVFHLHIHVVPRREGDRMPGLWPADAEWSRNDLCVVQDAVRAALAPRRDAWNLESEDS